MATPKGKVSKARRNSRRSAHWKLSMPGIVLAHREVPPLRQDEAQPSRLQVLRLLRWTGNREGRSGSEVISLHFVRPCLSKTRAHFLCPRDLPDF